MNKNEIKSLETFIGSIRGAEVTCNTDGKAPSLRISVVTDVTTAGVQIADISVDCPNINAKGVALNVLTTDGIKAIAIDPDAFSCDGAIKLRRSTDVKPRFWSKANGWSEDSTDAQMCSEKIIFSHRVQITGLANSLRVMRKKNEAEVWEPIPAREHTTSFPVEGGRITVPAVTTRYRLLAGETIKLLPLPVEVAPARKASTNALCF